MKWLWLLLIAAGVLIADIATKQLTVHFLSPGHSVSLFHGWLGGIDLAITHTTNTGAAWGVFEEWPRLLVAIRIVFIACLLGYLVTGRIANRLRLPLMLIAVGAIGNVIDFFVWGHVVDMVHATFWGHSFAVFNIADTAISVGTIWVLLTMVWPS